MFIFIKVLSPSSHDNRPVLSRHSGVAYLDASDAASEQ